MTMESAREAQGEGFAGGPTGLRRLTPSLLRADRTAEGFAGLPDGVTVPGQLLAAFKAAAPRLGLSPRLVHAVDWLFRFTQPQDWGRGGRPIVWPSASMQREALGLSPTPGEGDQPGADRGRADHHEGQPERQALRRARPGGADHRGLRLRPLADRRTACGVRAPGRGGPGGAGGDGPAAPAGDDRPERHHPDPRDRGRIRLRRARTGRAWPATPATSPWRSGRSRGPRRWPLGVESLERRQRAARERLESLLAAVTAGPSEAVDSDPKGPENRPHQYTYKPNPDPEPDTVVAPETCSRRLAAPCPARQRRSGRQARRRPNRRSRRGSTARCCGCRTDELVRLAPRLRAYLATPAPTWPDVVDAADWLRGELGVSKAAVGRGLSRHGPRGGGDRGGDRVGEAGGSFPVLAGRVFPRDGGEGEGRRAEPGADDLGSARA